MLTTKREAVSVAGIYHIVGRKVRPESPSKWADLYSSVARLGAKAPGAERASQQSRKWELLRGEEQSSPIESGVPRRAVRRCGHAEPVIGSA
jgi:hypothetical protein